ncbi:MAG: hypothetical protein Ct9H300mP19_07620 [Dehalococcoidia bacterium]|nr:MAG: hypothetical protein Ct9H300mP19_07620 [Dehalococcoidia bacterium]
MVNVQDGEEIVIADRITRFFDNLKRLEPFSNLDIHYLSDFGVQKHLDLG